MSNLPSTNPIPSVLTNARVYEDGKVLMGVASVELPSLEFMTESIAGLGIAGEVDTPVQGHFGSLKVKLKWNTTTADAVKLIEMKAHHLDVRGNIQKHDPGTGEYIDVPIKVLMRSTPVSINLGSVEPAKKMDSETELEVTFIKVCQDGKDLFELDKFNFIFKVLGVDKMAAIRQNLGMN